MRPKRYPYSGQMKKQPHDEIALLKNKINYLESSISQARSELIHLISKDVPTSDVLYPADFNSSKSSSKGIS